MTLKPTVEILTVNAPYHAKPLFYAAQIGHAGSMPVIFVGSAEDADQAAFAVPGAVLLCVSVPHSRFVTNAVDAKAFFEEHKCSTQEK